MSPGDRPSATTSAGAFTRLYRRVGRPLYATALRMLSRPEEAEDVVQESFLKLFRQAPPVPADREEAWLRRVVTNDCLDRLRRRNRRPEAVLDEGLAGTMPRPGGLAVDLERAVRRLPERAREVFLLHDVEGFKHSEVAEMLGVTVGASKSQLFRARGLLRDRLRSLPEVSS